MSSGLIFVEDTMPGITRRRSGRYWAYFDAEGERITDRDEIDRLNAIALPPAYRNAWFCPLPNGHIQATGHDDRGRKQYRYHPDFRARQDAAKYDRCTAFGHALPLLRARVERDLANGGLGKDKAIAAVIRLLDLGRIRVGNVNYARENGSFGATTLRKRHAKVKGNVLKLEYKAKSGLMRRLQVTDRSLIRFVRRMQDLPGQSLFTYLDNEDQPHPVGSSDVNAYIRDAMGEDFTAKHFRTWSASVIAFEALREADGHLPLKQLLEPVAEALGNTPAISRKSYIHPALIDCATSALDWPEDLPRQRATKYLSAAERGLITFFESIEDQKTPKRAA